MSALGRARGRARVLRALRALLRRRVPARAATYTVATHHAAGSRAPEATTAITAFGGDDYHETVLADQTTIRQARLRRSSSSSSWSTTRRARTLSDARASPSPPVVVFARALGAPVGVNLEENCAHEERGLPTWPTNRAVAPRGTARALSRVKHSERNGVARFNKTTRMRARAATRRGLPKSRPVHRTPPRTAAPDARAAMTERFDGPARELQHATNESSLSCQAASAR